MFESLQNFVPAEWRGAFEFLSAPLAWLPDFNASMINIAWYGNSFGEVLAKRGLILMPILLGMVAMWCTMMSLYTLPFRSARGRFMTTLVMSWWDVGRSVWFFWAGFVRLIVLVAGWLWGGTRLGLRMLAAAFKGVVRSPLLVLDWTSRTYFKPGVPWIAFLALLLWCAVEATIFMYTLSPTMTEVLAGITGYEPNPYFMGPILWLFLFMLILGSFACIQVFTEAVRARRIGEITQMAFVEAFVMFFEVIFLYRELIDAVAPWIAQTTNEAVQLGLVSTLLLASFGWVGVRGMTWFLFGRFGTPAVLAILSRETVTQGEVPAAMPVMAKQEIWKQPIAALKEEIEWFKKEGKHAFELLSLPVLQLLAAAVNFIVVIITAEPVFGLPFKSLNQVLAITPRWSKKGANGGQAQPTPVLEPVQGGAP
jgi:hypothetical protein